jgi:hypothetical protein
MILEFIIHFGKSLKIQSHVDFPVKRTTKNHFNSKQKETAAD